MAYQSVTATVSLVTKARYLHSFSFAENAGTPAAARVQLRDGSSGGTVVLDIHLSASESKTVSLNKPIYFPLGIYVLVSTGTVRGSIDTE